MACTRSGMAGAGVAGAEGGYDMAGNGNGSGELPDARRAAGMHGLEQYHAMAADRDALGGEIGKLRVELAAMRVVADAHDSLQAQADSRVASAYAERDQAVRE